MTTQPLTPLMREIVLKLDLSSPGASINSGMLCRRLGRDRKQARALTMPLIGLRNRGLVEEHYRQGTSAALWCLTPAGRALAAELKDGSS